MIEKEEETSSYPHHPPQPNVDSSEEDEITIQHSGEETSIQSISSEPVSDPAKPEPSSEQAASDSAETASTVAIAPVPAPTISAQPENTIHATAKPTQPYMSIDDLLALKIVSNPQISPDSTMIAFVLQHNNVEQNTTGSSIWLVSATAGKNNPPRQLTSGIYHDTAPRWSPHGQALAFLSDRTGKPQLYLLPMSGGETQQVSSLPQGITEYSWHPSGHSFLAHSYWKPADEQEKIEAAEQVTSYKHLGEQWDGIGDKQGRHLQLWLIPLGGKATRRTSEPVDLVQSCWSPDGTEIAFCANRRSNPDLSESMALWVLTLATGQLRRLTPEEGVAQMPAWSPDSQWIAYLYSPDQTEARNMSPWVVAASGYSAPQAAVPEAENFTCQAWMLDELNPNTSMAHNGIQIANRFSFPCRSEVRSISIAWIENTIPSSNLPVEMGVMPVHSLAKMGK